MGNSSRQAVVIVTRQKKTAARRRPFSLPMDAGSAVAFALAVPLLLGVRLLALALGAVVGLLIAPLLVLARLLLVSLGPLAVLLQPLLVRLDLPLVTTDFLPVGTQLVF